MRKILKMRRFGAIMLAVLGCWYFSIYFTLDRVLYSITPSSKVPLDVVLVGAPKDFEMIPYSVASIKKYLKHPINKMVLVAPKSAEAQELASSLDMEFIDENSLLSKDVLIKWVKDNQLTQNHNSANEWTWHYQQFLKLLYYKISKSDNYLIVDSDVVIQRPLIFVYDNGMRTFYIAPDHAPSRVSARSLLGNEQYIPEFSFISDIMCFNKQVVEQMIHKIESKFNTEFYKAGILVEQNSEARFSEYELYGVYANYSQDSKPYDVISNYLPAANKGGKRQFRFLNSYNVFEKKYPYISYHHYIK